MLDQNEYYRLKQKQLDQTLTSVEYNKLQRLDMYVALNPHVLTKPVSKAAQNPNHSVLYDTSDNEAANSSLARTQKALRDNAEKQSFIDGPAQENIFIDRKSVSQATGLGDDYLRVNVNRKNIAADDAGNIELKSLSKFVTDRLEKSWADYLRFSEAQSALTTN